MKRRLVSILAGLSLLLFTAVVVLWVRSYFQLEAIGRAHMHPAATNLRPSPEQCPECGEPVAAARAAAASAPG